MAQTLVGEVMDEMQLIGKDVASDLRKTTDTWSNKPTFEVQASKNGVEVTTEDEVWNMVDRGTRAHNITPVNAPALVFLSKYRAKTRPGSLSSLSGGKSGKVVFAQAVRHPGFPARNFSASVTKRWQPRIAGRIRKRLDKGLEAVGL